MDEVLNPVENYERTKRLVGYLSRNEAEKETYLQLGFKCGLEIHQQLKTEKKLFCRCPAGIYQKDGEFDAEVIRHMRPTLSELGEYDGTALMEFKTRKKIIYRIKNETACTYDIDDTPPFSLNREALSIAMEIALLLKTSIVGELHITRKQYLDGSIPTGFQRSAIVGIDGQIPLAEKVIRISQLSIEEDACREVSDIRHTRIYTTDRLGMPLIEAVTYPDISTPREAAEAANHIRFLTRSTGKVRIGIGAAREDVNVSINGGQRVEIKGVAHISWIPELTHTEAFRQKALLEIKKTLHQRVSEPSSWNMNSVDIPVSSFRSKNTHFTETMKKAKRIVGINLPGFKGILSFFTQPDKIFADELSDRLLVIACLMKPNMTHSEALEPILSKEDLRKIQTLLKSRKNDAQVIFWGPEEDIETALETIEERCRLAFLGVPNETRKALKNGTTMFERVLPGPDRMYPDTDSVPIPIDEAMLHEAEERLPLDVSECVRQLAEWGIPADTYDFILRRNLFSLIERIITDFEQEPAFVGIIVGQRLKHAVGRIYKGDSLVDIQEPVYEIFRFIHKKKLERGIALKMLPVVIKHPDMDLDSALETIGYKKISEKEILAHIPVLRKTFKRVNTSNDESAESLWIMGKLRPLAEGNMSLSKLREAVDGGVG